MSPLVVVVGLVMLSCSSANAASEEDWLMISRCQATCLVQFGMHLSAETQEKCFEHNDCYVVSFQLGFFVKSRTG